MTQQRDIIIQHNSNELKLKELMNSKKITVFTIVIAQSSIAYNVMEYLKEDNTIEMIAHGFFPSQFAMYSYLVEKKVNLNAVNLIVVKKLNGSSNRNSYIALLIGLFSMAGFRYAVVESDFALNINDTNKTRGRESALKVYFDDLSRNGFNFNDHLKNCSYAEELVKIDAVAVSFYILSQYNQLVFIRKDFKHKEFEATYPTLIQTQNSTCGIRFKY